MGARSSSSKPRAPRRQADPLQWVRWWNCPPPAGPDYTEEQLSSLTSWERWLLGRKPIIALDGYIPNSVVRAQIGYVKPQTPKEIWFLRDVSEA